jgi:hypothetical protein
MLGVRTLFVLALLGLACSVDGWAGDCADQQNTVDSLQAKIKADQKDLQRHNVRLTADALHHWLQASTAERRHLLFQSLTESFTTYVAAIAAAPEQLAKNALKPMTILDYPLPNGVGSFGTAQVNAMLDRLQHLGVTSDTFLGRALVRAIGKLSLIRDKKGTVEYIELLSTMPSLLKDTAERGQSEESVEAAATALQIAAGIAGKGDFAAAIGHALFQSIHNEFEAYILASAMQSPHNASKPLLKALKVLSANLQRDGQALQVAQGQLEACQKSSRSRINTAQEQAQTPSIGQSEQAYCAQGFQACWIACTLSSPTQGVDLLTLCRERCGNCDHGQTVSMPSDISVLYAEYSQRPDAVRQDRAQSMWARVLELLQAFDLGYIIIVVVVLFFAFLLFASHKAI